MSQCSSELQTNTQDLQMQTLISRVAQLESQMILLESKLDTHLTAQAACNPCARDSTTSTATCCETSQATIWKPTPLIAMFELMNTKMLQLESLIASTAGLGAVIDDSSNTELENKDCLTQLENQFNERMANMETLLEMTTSGSTKERNESSATSSEQNSTVSPTDQLQTVIKVISQASENSPIDKCELLKGYLDNMTLFTAGSTTTTVLSKREELAEIVNMLAGSSISAEHYTRLELLVDMIADSSGKSDKCIDSLKKQVKANADELKLIISKEKELDDKCAIFQALVADKTKKKNSKSQRLLFDTQLLVLNAMSSECKAYKANLQELSATINEKLQESLFHIINAYLMTELELQLSKSKLDSAHSLTQQQQSVVPKTTDIRELSKITCVLVGNTCTGKTTIFQSYKNKNLSRDNGITIGAAYNLAKHIVDGMCFELHIWDTGGVEKLEDVTLSLYCRAADVILICLRTYFADCYDTPSERHKASYWISVVRQRYPVTPIVLVDIDMPNTWNSKKELSLTSGVEDRILLAEQNNAVTYIKCSFNMDDINAVFVAAVRATEKAKQLQAALANTPQPALDQRLRSKLDKFKLFLTGRRPDDH